MVNFYVLEYTTLGPRVVDLTYKHTSCTICGVVPVGRVGSIAVRFSRKDDLVDICPTTEGLIVRQSVIDHLAKERIVGWRAGALRVSTVQHLASQDISYSELVVIGHTRGYAEKVGLTIDRECQECGRRSYFPPLDGLVFPQECWDGSDIFQMETVGVVVTEAFRQVVEKYGHTGASFIPIAEWRPLNVDIYHREQVRRERLTLRPEVWPPSRFQPVPHTSEQDDDTVPST